MENSYESYKREQVDNTPFVLETDEQKGWRLGLGNHGITDWDKDESKLKKRLAMIKKTDWNFMTICISIIAERIIEHKTWEMMKDLEKAQNNEG